MRSILRYLVALVTFGLGADMIVTNTKTLTLPVLIGAGALILVAYAMMFPNHLKAAVGIVAPYLPFKGKSE